MENGKVQSTRFLLFFVAVLVLMAGCGDDDGSTMAPEQKFGTIVVDVDPDTIELSWQISGPVELSGVGDRTIEDMPIGLYTIIWGDDNDVLSPRGATSDTLNVDERVTFRGVYIYLSTLIPITAGSFAMGSPEHEEGRNAYSEQLHNVTLTRSYAMSYGEVTNREYASLAQWAYDNGYCEFDETSQCLVDLLCFSSNKKLMYLGADDAEILFQDDRFSVRSGLDHHPARYVSWYGAATYCDWLNIYSELPLSYGHETWICNDGAPYDAEGFRLPTEAEWEYACRADTQSPFSAGACLDAGGEANYDGMHPYLECPEGPSLSHTTPKGNYVSNAYHLVDMHGNISEWCNDWIAPYSGDETDPVGPADPGDSGRKAVRGGAWYVPAEGCRSAARLSVDPQGRFSLTGIRFVWSLF